MATEYKLSYTAAEIDEKLGKVDSIEDALPLKGGKLTGRLTTRDVRVGGEYDVYGVWGAKNPLIVGHTPVNESIKNSPYISTMKILESGRYYLILPEGSNYLYKMQITDDNGTRILNINDMPVIAAGDYLDNNPYDVGIDGIWIIFSAKTRIDDISDSPKTFEDGFVGLKRLNFQKNTTYQSDNTSSPYPSVEFYTNGSAEVTIWWAAGADNRYFAIQHDNKGGAARLAVSGTLELHGEVKAENSSFRTHHMDVGGELKVHGDTTLYGQTKIDESLDVGTELTVGARINMKNGSTLDMNGGDVKNVQSIEIDGTAKLLNDVRIKNNTNRDYTIKLSDALDEALGWGFKRRIDVTKMPGATFTEQFINAITVAADGDIVYIPSGAYDLVFTADVPQIVVAYKNIHIMGCSKELPVINYTRYESYDCIHVSEFSATLENLVLQGEADATHNFICTWDGSITMKNCKLFMPSLCHSLYMTFDNCEFTNLYTIERVMRIERDADELVNAKFTNCKFPCYTASDWYITVSSPTNLLFEKCEFGKKTPYIIEGSGIESTVRIVGCDCQDEYNGSRVLTQADLETALGVIENGAY